MNRTKISLIAVFCLIAIIGILGISNFSNSIIPVAISANVLAELSDASATNQQTLIDKIPIDKIPIDKIPIDKIPIKKKQIAYLESETFTAYPETLIAIIDGLIENGWMDKLDQQQWKSIVATNDSRVIWQWLVNNDVSDRIEFVDTGFHNLRDIDFDREEYILWIQQNQQLDVILAMGAAAGHLLATSDHQINTFVFAASNAVRSGIINSSDDSGQDHIWAHMDGYRFERQLKAFYDIFEFKRLGIVYEDSDAARVYSAINELEALAEEKGFTIIHRHVPEPLLVEDFEQYYQQVKAAYAELADEVDVFYLSIASIQPEWLPELLMSFYENDVPVFSQMGNLEVEYGALLTVSVMDYTNIGRFGADNIIHCLQGEKPRDLQQTFQSAPQISINVEVAKMIGYKLPYDLVMAVDRAY